MDSFRINDNGTVTLTLSMSVGKSKSGNKQLVPTAPFSPGYPPRREIQDENGTVWPFFGGCTIGQETPIASAPATTRQDSTDADAYVIIGGVAYPKAHIEDQVRASLAANVSQPVKRGRPVGSKNKVVRS